MKELISVSFQSLYPEIQRHLSVIGKRTHAKNGENLFTAVTLSSAETPILVQYLQEAAQNVTAEIKEFVSAYTETETSVSFMVTNTRWNDPYTPSFVEAFSENVRKYLVYYSIAEYLSMTFTELAKKYFEQAVTRLRAIIALVFFKAPPTKNDASVIAPTTVSQTMEIRPTRIGTTTFQFEIPTTALVDVFQKWQNLTIDCNPQSEDTRTITVMKMSDSTPILSNKQLPYQPSAYDIASVKNAAGSEKFVKVSTSFTIDEEARLLLIYSTNH